MIRHIEIVHRRRGITPAVPTAVRGLVETAHTLPDRVPGIRVPQTPEPPLPTSPA